MASYRLGLGVSLWALLAPGCSDQTGIIAEVSWAPDHFADVDRLELVVGVSRGAGSVTFTMDDESAYVADVGGRNLHRDPYRLLIHDETEQGAFVMVAVQAFGPDSVEGQPVAAGWFAQPQPFLEGQVILVPVELQTDRQVDVVGDGDCYLWGDGQQRWSIGSIPNDFDCDQDPMGIDCDDMNPNRAHTLPEQCDGVDNNCDSVCDEGELSDGDGDTFTWCGLATRDCSPDDRPDCDDGDASVNPAALEKQSCDQIDSDCDGCDFGDLDGDGYVMCSDNTVTGSCSKPAGDCGENNPNIHPGQVDVACDYTDADCDPESDYLVPCLASLAGEECVLGQAMCDEEAVINVGECTPTSHNIQLSASDCFEYSAGCGDVADSWACFATPLAGDVNAWHCTVFLQESTELCGSAYFFLPPPPDGTVNCAWYLPGGTTTPSYDIAIEGAGMNGDIVVGCMAKLKLLQVRNPPPEPEPLVILFQHGDGPWQVMRLLLDPRFADAGCPASGLSCVPM